MDVRMSEVWASDFFIMSIVTYSKKTELGPKFINKNVIDLNINFYKINKMQ